jgi:glycerophosphoryl diester phosphodiesterase
VITGVATAADEPAFGSAATLSLVPAAHPFLDHDGPIAFAHRGGAEEAPENTMPAFEAAVALGYRYLETDVHVTRDGVVVAFHDARLDRVTDRTGAIAELPIAEVLAADAGHRFSPDGGRSFPFRGRGVGVPRLDELLDRWPQVRINIDPKDDRCVEPLAAVVDRLDAWGRVCFGSFSDARLRRIRMLGRGRACTSMGPRAIAIARALAAAGWVPRQGADCIQAPPRRGRISIVTRRFVRAAHRTGLPVHVWTVDDPAAMDELLELGVDGIMTDRPRVLLDVLAGRDIPLR